MKVPGHFNFFLLSQNLQKIRNFLHGSFMPFCIWKNSKNVVRDHSFGTYPTFSDKLIFLTTDTYVCVSVDKKC